MGILDGLLQNPSVQKLAFGKLADLIKERNLSFIVVDLDEQEEIRIVMYGKDEGYAVLKPDFARPVCFYHNCPNKEKEAPDA